MSIPETALRPSEPRSGVVPRKTAAAPGILARAEAFADSFDRLPNRRDNPLAVIIEDAIDPVQSVIDGRPTIMFGTNSYLGLNYHADCIAAAVEATRRYGTGSTASRVAAGNHRLHVDLEADMAGFYTRRHAVVFSTGFMANLGVVSALVRKGDLILLDAHCHASIFDACRLTEARFTTFRHNDAADLERLLADSEVPGSQVLVVAEGLYSVRGDLGDLPALAAVVKRHGAVFVVDEAHGLGIYGRHGRGVCEHLGAEDDIDVIVGTFSKSVGVIGGFAVSNSPTLRALRFMARPYLYSASLPLAVVAAARQAIRLIAAEEALRAALWENARRLHDGLSALGLPLCTGAGPVGSIRMPGLAAGFDAWRRMLAHGIYVNLLIPPATPEGEVVLRFSVSAAHTPDHIAAAIAAFKSVLLRK